MPNSASPKTKNGFFNDNRIVAGFFALLILIVVLGLLFLNSRLKEENRVVETEFSGVVEDLDDGSIPAEVEENRLVDLGDKYIRVNFLQVNDSIISYSFDGQQFEKALSPDIRIACSNYDISENDKQFDYESIYYEEELTGDQINEYVFQYDLVVLELDNEGNQAVRKIIVEIASCPLQ